MRQERVPPEFDWKEDFCNARAAVQAAYPNAAYVLAQALTSAFRMADICQRSISRDKIWRENPGMLADWHEFLETLSNDAEFLYPLHLDLLARDAEGDLLTHFAKIARSALEAQIRISDRPSSPDARKRTIIQLRELMKSLQTTVSVLDPSPGGEVAGLPESRS